MAEAGAAGVVAADVGGTFAAGADIVSVTLPVDALRVLPRNARPSVAVKKIAAAIPVDFDKKFDEPVAPNKLPDAPEPNAAPISAPLPCCRSTSPIMVRADST